VEFPLLGHQVALDLANTLWVHAGRRIDALDTIGGADRWLTAVGEHRLWDGSTLVEVAGAAGLRVRDEGFRAELVGLRDQVRLLLGAVARGGRPAAAVLDVVNRIAAAAPSTVRLTSYESLGLRLRRVRPTPMATAVLAALAEDALATAVDTTQLKTCPGPNCLGIYPQDDPRRHYCSPTCANRARVARHYARSRTSQSKLP